MFSTLRTTFKKFSRAYKDDYDLGVRTRIAGMSLAPATSFFLLWMYHSYPVMSPDDFMAGCTRDFNIATTNISEADQRTIQNCAYAKTDGAHQRYLKAEKAREYCGYVSLALLFLSLSQANVARKRYKKLDQNGFFNDMDLN